MKLQRLFLFMVALAVIQVSRAAIVYTDVVPDLVTVPSATAAFDVDMDNNATPDFRFTCVDITGLRFIVAQAGAIGLGNFVLVDTVGGVNNAKALPANDIVSPFSMIWHSMASTNPALFSDLFGTFSGQWLGSVDYYLGVQFQIGTNMHYGWIRMNITQATGVVTLKDYAYDDGANNAILAGAMPGADPALNLTASDVDENSNGSDLQLAFSPAANEATVMEYRMMAVKNSTPTFNLVDAKAVPAGRYVAVVPNGGSYTELYGATTLDVDGDPIVIAREYRMYVLSKAAAGLSDDGLSAPSNPITLHTTAEGVFAFNCSDGGDSSNSSDIFITFKRPVKEFAISTYRAIVVKDADASNFLLADAQAVPFGRYQDFTPNGADVSTNMSAYLLDKDGDNIVQHIGYRMFIMSVANGVQADLDSLTDPSPYFELQIPDGIEAQTSLADELFVTGHQLRVVLYNSPKGVVQLLDMNGRMVQRIEVMQGENTLDLNLGKGIYMAVLEGRNTKTVRKLSISY